MNKLLKIVLCFLLVFTSGCSRKKDIIDEDIKLVFFYVDSCAHCVAFKLYAIPRMEEVFGDHLEIKLVNMDYEVNKQIYDEYTSQLIDYHEEQRTMPFIVVDGYFALLMYNQGEEDMIIDDIIAAVNHEELSDYFKNERWLFEGYENE